MFLYRVKRFVSILHLVVKICCCLRYWLTVYSARVDGALWSVLELFTVSLKYWQSKKPLCRSLIKRTVWSSNVFLCCLSVLID